jgi:hypothetical protein
MSNYPAWWDKTLTIYNKRIDATTRKITWHRTVVTNCFWKYVNEIYANQYTTVRVAYPTKSVIVRIPEDERFLKTGAYAHADDVTGKFTLAEGDIIILGEVDDELDEYTQGKRKSDIITKYKDTGECIEIKSHTDDVGTALALPHYHVLGV